MTSYHLGWTDELVHNFSLVHDVQDGDHARRGRPTVGRVWGVGQAARAKHAVAEVRRCSFGPIHTEEFKRVAADVAERNG